MDPLSIQMAMGSPPYLRGKSSLPNLTGRKKKSPASEKSTPSKTPRKLDKIDEQTPTTSLSRIDTVRKRRGFRPLSVLTNSAFVPFEQDTLKAMEELEDEEKDNGSGVLEDKAADSIIDSSHPQEKSTALKTSRSLTALPLTNNSEISLRAFLAQSSPADSTDPIKTCFPALCQLPAPDLSQHPANKKDPFASESNCLSLITTSSIDQIQSFAVQARNSSSQFTNRTSASSDVFGSEDKKRFTLLDKRRSPASPSKRGSTTSSEPSPLAKRQPKSRPLEVRYPSVSTPSADSDRKRSASGGIRKFSDMLKSKVGAEKQLSPTSNTTIESPKVTIQKLEEHLRRVTCSPTYQYTETSWLPRHPGTGRFWRSRNLKCTTCVDVCCACCGRTCCAYKAAAMALDTHKDNPQGREVAFERIQQITMVFPYGRELPTFLQCTHGSGDGPGCGKLVCPECCGICPDEICQDVQCRKCKPNPWAECDWHSSLSQTPNENDGTSVRHTV